MALILRRGRSNRDVGSESIVDEIDINHPHLELCITSSKGLGLFAKHDIKRGTRVLSEVPLVVIPAAEIKVPLRLWQRLEKLSPAELQQFDSLACNKTVLKPKTYAHVRMSVISSGKLRNCSKLLEGFVEEEVYRSGMFYTNATSLGPGDGSGVFSLYSRINHSCMPNVHASYNHSLGRHTVHAIRDIKAGEEILSSYVDCAQPLGDRNAALDLKGIDCYCAVCTKGTAAARSERHRDRLHDIIRGLRAYDGKLDRKERIHARIVPRDPKEALVMAEESILLLKEEALVGMTLASAYRQSSRYCMQQGMVEKAKAYAKKELEVERYCLGVETGYLNEGRKGDNAECWMKQIEWQAEKESVKIRMCEKRCLKEQKKAEKKAAKKAEKR